MRMELGWSQVFLSDLLGVGRSSLAHWEQGRAPIPVGFARRMRKAHSGMMKIVEDLCREDAHLGAEV